MSTEHPSVLVLDDEVVVRESLADYFEDCGWRVWQSASAEEALKLLEVESPEGALVDIRLPGMRGDSFIREAHRMRPSLAFVIVTGSPELCRSGDGRSYVKDLPATVERVFEKTITDLADLERTLKQHIRTQQKATRP